MDSDLVEGRSAVDALRAAMYDWDAARIDDALAGATSGDAVFRLSFPFETMGGRAAFANVALAPLHRAMPDIERRDYIVMAGRDPDGAPWIGCGGFYTGTFVHPFLDIPPTGHQAAMRFHEFYRVDDGRIVEMQALWDLPELMMQSGVWPMGPSLGRTWSPPGPATNDGVRPLERNDDESTASCEHVRGMLADMGRHPTEPVEAMRLEHWWHPKFSWYGPAGIGTSRGIDGFRNWHQAPFLRAMPDRRGGYRGTSHFFGDGPYVAVTAWPGMSMTLTGDGWLGIAPSDQPLTMRSLDFWRIEQTESGPKIRENWVLVDLLSVWDQIGVSVLDRMRELSPARRTQ